MVAATRSQRSVRPGGDPYGAHRALEPARSLPQPAWRVDNDFSRIFEGELLLSVDTLNIDAASFTQMVGEAEGDSAAARVAGAVRKTVADRGKQHNPVTGSGGMLLGTVLQSAGPHRSGVVVGDRVATLVSLSLTPLFLDEIREVRVASAQLDVRGEAVLFETGICARLPDDLPERVALALLDVAGAAPQVHRLATEGGLVVVLGAGGKSGLLCVAEARRRVGPQGMVIGVETHGKAASELRELGYCDAVVEADARDPLALRHAVLAKTAGREADLVLSCVNVEQTELAAILLTRARGTCYFFAMSTSFTRAALGAEGVGKDIDLMIGNGYAAGHAEHSLALLGTNPRLRALFVERYG